MTLPHVANVVKPKTTTKTTIRRKIEGIQQELLHSVLNACCETLFVDSSVFPVHIAKGKDNIVHSVIRRGRKKIIATSTHPTC